MLSFSVLISVYIKENPSFLLEALESLHNQSYQPNEIVLIEDGPLTKELYDVIEEYASRKANLKVVKLPYNVGLGKALNEGLKHCSYDLIARMDSDDISLPDRFQKQVCYFESHSDVSIVGGWIREFDKTQDDAVYERRPPSTHSELLKYMKYRNPFNHMTVMFKRADVIKAGGYQDLYFLEDYYLWVRMSILGFRFFNIPDVLVYARVGRGMLARRGGWKYIKSEYRLLSFMYKFHILNFIEYISSFMIKTFVRAIGSRARSYLYRLFLRK